MANRAASDRPPIVALIGNPNTGKSSLFNALCGGQARVGNYPGVTVEHKTGRMLVANSAFKSIELVDLPGTYSLSARSADEAVSVEVLCGEMPSVARPDAVIVILDATNLERNLYLLSQVLELQIPTLVALNMWDRLEKEGMRLDAEKLSDSLGVRVVCTSASKRIGIAELQSALLELLDRGPGADSQGILERSALASATFPEAFRNSVDELEAWFVSQGCPLQRFQIERLLIDDSQAHSHRVIPKRIASAVADRIGQTREHLASNGVSIPLFETRARYGWIKQRVAGVVERQAREQRVSTSDRIDRWLTHRWFGLLFFIGLMFFIFQSITGIASWPMDGIGFASQWLGQQVESMMGPGPLRSLLVDGIIAGVGAVLVFLPQIAILFFFIAVLEDCGYMSRAAFMMDKFMSALGMSGKSFLPLMSSFACAIPGIMATRTIENRRDRMVTLLIAPLMSCSARWPVYVLMVSAFVPKQAVLGGWVSVQGAVLFAMMCLGALVAIPVAWLLKRFVFPGEPSTFIMELSSYKWPSFRVVAMRVWERVLSFIARAGTLIFVTSVLVWAAAYFPGDHSLLDQTTAKLETEQASPNADPAKIQAWTSQVNQLKSDLIAKSFLGVAGQWIEPIVRPLGWDGKIGVAVLASFPAREVIVATLGTIYSLGGAQDETSDGLAENLRSATWPDGRPVYTLATACSIMVFFALCAQCVSTLVTIRRETNSWRWPIFSFVYMTTLAYLGAWIVYNLMSAWLVP
ncbi:MAG: ferrous iron transport protein B [Planctomycetota bacterium]|nr:ferrous iron transport protein B [Planctomycetota bacterium]